MVLRYARLALGHNRYALRLTDVDKWAVVEQAFLAALDLHEFDRATEFLAKLDRKFPGATRVARLKARHT